MTVNQLKKLLDKMDGKRIVILAKDSEGNGYSPLDGVYEGAYAAETTWYGKFGMERLTEADKKAGYGEEDVVKGKPAIVLAPVN